MTKFLTAVCISGILFSCAKNQEVFPHPTNPLSSDLNEKNAHSPKLSELQSQGYFLFLSPQDLELEYSFLRATKTPSKSLSDFFSDEKVLSILSYTHTTDIAKELKQTNAFEELTKLEQEAVLNLFTNSKVILCIDDFKKLFSKNKSEMRSLTYGQFYHTPKGYRGTGAFFAKAAGWAIAGFVSGGGPTGAAAGFMASMFDQLLSAGKNVKQVPIDTTDILEVGNEYALDPSVFEP